jgi:hypothetical protein
LVPPTISKIDLTGATVSLSLGSVSGLNYVLEYKNTLDAPAWLYLPPALPGTGSVLTLQDTNAVGSSRFYRIRSY